MNSITISSESPVSKDAALLMEELSECLKAITGDSGKSSFHVEDIQNDRSLFVIARDQNGVAVGCGAFRPVDDTVAEVKRMYAQTKGVGIGKEVLSYLEIQAGKMGYTTIQLETRLVNKRAVSFYLKNGYTRIPNYGRYICNPKAICFQKRLAADDHS